MPARFLCPHCHASLDPSLLEEVDGAGCLCRICPECDGLIPVSVPVEIKPEDDSVVPDVVIPQKRVVHVL